MNLSMGVFLEMPKQYRERPTHDLLCHAWNDALDVTTLASIAMDKLGGLLRTRAGIKEPGPQEALRQEGDAPYKPISSEWNLLSACMGKVRDRAQLIYDRDPAQGDRLIEEYKRGLGYPEAKAT